MLLRLLPNQIMKYWDEIKYCIYLALPPHVEPNYLAIQEKMLIGEMDCWVIIFEGTIRAVITTQFVMDACTDTKQLLVFSLTATEAIYIKTWEEAYNTMMKYAASRNCDRIIAYIRDDKLVDLAEHFNAETSWRLLSWVVERREK